ncbi:MAG: efflux RND transporter periplasmic adaptor subunit [Planctomycetota bacterium]|nr:efflux RND transporter periplasmic adaptor subunit [Planctomycetota bacterium]MDA1165914.1 efflux RND transporter periplasmic adaptor subunit [Planctomycetota bacterium]
MRYILFLISVIFCGAAGWHLYEESLASVESDEKAKPSGVSAVDVIRVVRQPIDERIELVGSLEPVSAVEIRSRLSGYLLKVPFDIGDRVEKSQTVVELDDALTRELVTRSSAAEQVAAAQLKAQIAKEEQSRREVDRLRELARSGVSTTQQIEEAESALSVCLAETELERARLAQASADLERSKLALNELRITTPMNGFVAERYVNEGDLAGAEDVLLRIVDLSSIRTVVNIVERDYEKLRIGQDATITVDGIPGREFSGQIVRKAPVLDPTTRTARVMIEIANADSLLKPGMHGRVTIIVAQYTNAIVVPAVAIHDHDGSKFLYTIDSEGKTARQQDVSIGFRDGDMVQVLTGLSEDALVVTLGGRLIKDGSTVEFAEIPASATEPELALEVDGNSSAPE